MDSILTDTKAPSQNEEPCTEETCLSTTSESSVSGTSDSSPYESNDEYNRHLQARILCLRETIQALKGQLHDEREIWRREMEERRENDYINRAAEMGYQYYSDPKMMNAVNSVAGLENDLNKYPENLYQSHYEHRQNLQKQIAMSNYKRRLLEVENMCNLELLRVKQSVQILQPLQMMCSEWKFPGEGGDSNKDLNEGVKADVTTDEEKLKNSCRPAEVSMPLEMIAQKTDILNSGMGEAKTLGMTRSQPNLNEFDNAIEESRDAYA